MKKLVTMVNEKNIKNIILEIRNTLLVAVSKKKSVEEIKEAIETGVQIIGENRIQEAEKKYKKLKDYFCDNKVEFHFIGHLQTNKAKKAVKMFDLIQTVDSIKLAQEIDKRAEQINKIQDVLIEVNISREPQKTGIIPEDTIKFLKSLSGFYNIKVRGLMCIPRFGKDSRPYFQLMKQLFDESKLEILSMGMSNDYKVAIEEGSNMIRIGTKIFGERNK